MQTIRYWLGIIITAVQNWMSSQAFVYAAALAFFTVFSIAPVTIVAVTIVGIVLGERAAQGQIMAQLQGVIGPEAAGVVQTAVVNAQIDHSGLWPTILGIGLILAGASTVFAQMQASLNAIWEVAPNPTRNSIFLFIKSRILSLTVVLAIGFILLVSLLLSVALGAIVEFASGWLPIPAGWMVALDAVLSLAVISLLFAALFRVLPDVVLRWRDVWVGAVVTAGLFTLGRWLIALYLAHTATASAYGAAGSLVLLLLWVNYSSLILLYGAAFTRAHYEARGRQIVPRRTAMRVHRELVPADARQEGTASADAAETSASESEALRAEALKAAALKAATLEGR
ncbi:MAG: YihY/virulence factor BrkB family protein [Burkholderiales bacterium]|nr:YihY/virulence factor BrkB family protein [Burkholderiales bacterium]